MEHVVSEISSPIVDHSGQTTAPSMPSSKGEEEGRYPERGTTRRLSRERARLLPSFALRVPS